MYNTKMYTTENYTSTFYRAKIFVFCDKYRKKKRTSKRIKQNGHMYMLWFNFILGSNFLFFSFWV